MAGVGQLGAKLLGNQHPEDAARLAYDTTLYNNALAGDAPSLHRLGTLAGIIQDSDPQQGIAATETQKNDAAQKYQAVVGGGSSAINAQRGPTATTAGGGGIGEWVASIFGPTAARAGAAAGTAGANQAAAKLQGTVVVMGVLLVGVAVVLFVELGKRKG